jgi:hypothetical protein
MLKLIENVTSNEDIFDKIDIFFENLFSGTLISSKRILRKS